MKHGDESAIVILMLLVLGAIAAIVWLGLYD